MVPPQPPRRWRDVLAGPAFVINLDSRPERLAATLDGLRCAGFTDIRRFQAVDARDPDALRHAWSACGAPRFAEWDEAFRQFPGKQGCFLSHLGLWADIVANEMPFACVFEDDVVFHHHWATLAPTYFGFTPPEWDVVFFGSQIEAPGTGLVRRTPVHCTHAYIIRREGAERLRAQLLGDPGGVATIDSMIVGHQWTEHRGGERAPFDWYVWDGTTFPDRRAIAHEAWKRRNTGLVFQDFTLGSDVGGVSIE